MFFLFLELRLRVAVYGICQNKRVLANMWRAVETSVAGTPWRLVLVDLESAREHGPFRSSWRPTRDPKKAVKEHLVRLPFSSSINFCKSFHHSFWKLAIVSAICSTMFFLTCFLPRRFIVVFITPYVYVGFNIPSTVHVWSLAIIIRITDVWFCYITPSLWNRRFSLDRVLCHWDFYLNFL